MIFRAPILSLAVVFVSLQLAACDKLAFHPVQLEGDPSDASADAPDTAVPPDAGASGTCGYQGDRTTLVDLATMADIWRTDTSNAHITDMPGRALTGWRTDAWILVESDNVALSDFYIGSTGATGGFFSIATDQRGPGAGLRVSNGTIEASAVTDTPEFGVFVDVNDVGLSDLDISGMLSGITVRSDDVTVDQVCVHDLHPVGTASSGVYVGAGNRIVVRNATITDTTGQVTPIAIANDLGAIDDVLVENVRISGGRYSISVRGDGSASTVTNVRFRNVVVEQAGDLGFIDYAGAPGAIVEWDVRDGQGAPIAAP